MPPAVRAFLARILLPVVVLLVAMIGLGLFVTKVAGDVWPFTVEDAFNRDLAGHRSGSWNTITLFFSDVGSTPVIIGVTVLVAVLLRVWLHRWREPLMLCVPPHGITSTTR